MFGKADLWMHAASLPDGIQNLMGILPRLPFILGDYERTIFSFVRSSFIHYLFTKQIESSIQLLTMQLQQIAKKKFAGSLPEE